MNLSGIKLIDKMMSHVECGLMEEIKSQLVGKASQLCNAQEFCSSLVNHKVLDAADLQLTAGPEVEERKRIEMLIKAVCSKKAIGSLVMALQHSDNGRILEETFEWLEASQARKKNYPMAVKDPSGQRMHSEPKVFGSCFFQHAAASDQLSNLGTFKSLQKSTPKGVPLVQFDTEGIMACSADGTLDLWKLRGNEQASKIAGNVKNITSFQYDDEILILATDAGTVHLLDVRTLEEKWAIRLSEPVIPLKFVESTLVVITQLVHNYTFWWVDIFRPDMRLLNHRPVWRWRGLNGKILIPGVLMYPDTTFVYIFNIVQVYDTKSGRQIKDVNKRSCYLVASNAVYLSMLNGGDLISTKRVVVAGCMNGMMAVWNTSNLKFNQNQSPVKIFQGHWATIVSLCFLNGHLLSLDGSGKLLMWSGYDLENSIKPVPRVVIESSNFTFLAAHERWFASSSSNDNTISMWTLPDLWLRTG